MRAAAAPLGFGDLGADVRAASAACAASQAELKTAADVIAREILRLEWVHRQVTHLVSRLEERIAVARPAA